MIHMIRTPKLPFIQSRASAPVTFLTNDRDYDSNRHTIYDIWKVFLGLVALPAAYFAYLLPCILLYMVLATSLKKSLCPSLWRIALRRCNNELEELWMTLFGTTEWLV